MNKFEKILYLSAVGLNVGAGLMNVILQNWILGVNQLCLAWFMFMYYKNRTK